MGGGGRAAKAKNKSNNYKMYHEKKQNTPQAGGFMTWCGRVRCCKHISFVTFISFWLIGQLQRLGDYVQNSYCISCLAAVGFCQRQVSTLPEHGPRPQDMAGEVLLWDRCV